MTRALYANLEPGVCRISSSYLNVEEERKTPPSQEGDLSSKERMVSAVRRSYGIKDFSALGILGRRGKPFVPVKNQQTVGRVPPTKGLGIRGGHLSALTSAIGCVNPKYLKRACLEFCSCTSLGLRRDPFVSFYTEIAASGDLGSRKRRIYGSREGNLLKRRLG